VDNLKYRGFKGETTVFPEFRDRFGIADINFMVMDPYLFQSFFELFTLQIFFFGVDDQFSHSLPSCIIHTRYRIIERSRYHRINAVAGSVSFTSDMLRKTGQVSIYINQIKGVQGYYAPGSTNIYRRGRSSGLKNCLMVEKRIIAGPSCDTGTPDDNSRSNYFRTE